MALQNYMMRGGPDWSARWLLGLWFAVFFEPINLWVGFLGSGKRWTGLFGFIIFRKKSITWRSCDYFRSVERRSCIEVGWYGYQIDPYCFHKPFPFMSELLKVYKTSILVFKDRAKYMMGEFRWQKYCKGYHLNILPTSWFCIIRL